MYSQQRIDERSGGIGNKSISGDHQNYSTVKIGQNTVKSSEDLRRLVVTQAPVEDHWLMVVWKALKGENIYFFQKFIKFWSVFKIFA